MLNRKLKAEWDQIKGNVKWEAVKWLIHFVKGAGLGGETYILTNLALIQSFVTERFALILSVVAVLLFWSVRRLPARFGKPWRETSYLATQLLSLSWAFAMPASGHTVRTLSFMLLQLLLLTLIEAILSSKTHSVPSAALATTGATTDAHSVAQASISGVVTRVGNADAPIRTPVLEVRFDGEHSPYCVKVNSAITSVRIGIYNPGPLTLENVKMELTSLTPQPKCTHFNNDFPYRVRHVSAFFADAIGVNMNAGEEVFYEVLKWFGGSKDDIVLEGVDTKRNDGLLMRPREKWTAVYKITCSGMPPQEVRLCFKRNSNSVKVTKL